MNKIEVTINGSKYNVRTDESADYVKRVEKVLNDHINEVSSANRRFSDNDKLMLSSFVITEKYIRAVSGVDELKEQAYAKIQEFRDALAQAESGSEDLKRELESAQAEKDNYREKLLAKDSDREYLNSQISKLQDKINELEQELKQSEILINDLKVKNEELLERCDTFVKERESFTKELNFANNTKSSLNGRISKLQIKLNEKEQLINQYEKTIKDLRGVNEELSLKVEYLNEENKKNTINVQSMNQDKDYLNSKISQLQQKINDRDAEIQSRDNAILSLKDELEEAAERYEAVNEEKEKYLEEILMANGDKEGLTSHVTEMQEKLNRKESELFQNEIHINELKKENDELKRENADLMKLLDEETSN